MNLRHALRAVPQITFVGMMLFASRAFAVPFAEDVLAAIKTERSLPLKRLLDRAPKSFSFKGQPVEGDIVLAAYRWLLLADDDTYLEILKLVQRLANLGISAHAPIPLATHAKTKEAIGAIVDTWTKIAKEANPNDRLQTNLRSTMFFDALLAAGGLNVNAIVEIPMAKGGSFRIPISQWGLLIDGSDAIFEYFMTMGADPAAINSLQMTAPMILALHGKLGALEKFALRNDPKRTAAAFAHVEANANRYTALNYAIFSVHAANASVADVLELLDFLSRRGVNPEPSGAAQTLMVSAKLMSQKYPAHQKTYEKLITALPAVLPRLRENFSRAQAASCESRLSSAPAIRH